MESESFILEEEDLQKLVRLLAATAVLGGGRKARKRFLLENLSEMIGADTWGWALTRSDPGGVPILLDLMGNITGVDLLLGQPGENALASAETAGNEIPIALRIKGSYVEEPADIGPLLSHSHPATAMATAIIQFFRRRGLPDFSLREKGMIEIVLSELPWLNEASSPVSNETHLRKLPGRQQICLTLMGEGRSRKEIAETMKISINTVAGYAREIYRHFEVKSQSELMRTLKQKGSFRGAKS